MPSATASAPAPIVSAVLPEQGTSRMIMYFMLAFSGSILLWVSAKISVPFIPVPMTMQTLAVMVLASTYGFRLGLAAALLYVLEGALGLPVFATSPERGIGLAYMMGPTGGYIVGFVLAVGFVGWFAERGADRSFIRSFVIMSLGSAIVLGLGFAWLSRYLGVPMAFTSGVLPFVVGDLFKIAIAALLVPMIGRIFRPRQG
ncbi:MAG TPA: biotin transporter BioY [Devosia sp.]|nr:biotin transporter BioY [Devosia sp.]